jgi:two-component system response regulator RegA
MHPIANHSSPDTTSPRLLLVDDDESHCWALRRAFEKRQYAVQVARSVQQACDLLAAWSPAYAVVDLRMPGPSGLELIPRLRATNSQVCIVMLTGYASIATAVQAIKLGATYYLTKPVDADMVEVAFRRAGGDETIVAAERPLSVERLEWEHIHHVLTEHSGNLSATARALGMHRRTLQRKLSKHPPPANVTALPRNE